MNGGGPLRNMLGGRRLGTWFKKCCFQVTPKIARAALAKGFRVSSVTLI